MFRKVGEAEVSGKIVDLKKDDDTNKDDDKNISKKDVKNSGDEKSN